MPGPTPDPVPSAETLPARVDTVVIGGGIIGCCTALELAERGLSVLLCEKGHIGGEQSSRNWGWVRLTHRDPREMELMVESARLWQQLDQRVEGQTGYRQCGIAFGFRDAAGRADLEQWLPSLRDYQLSASIASAQELSAMFPGMDHGLKGALVNRADGRAEPQKAAPAVARRAQELGATVMTGCAVRSLETAAGRVSGVVTEKGTVACDSVVVAGGAWSRLFLGNAGVELPQLRLRNTVLRTAAVPEGPDVTIKHPDFTARRRADGGYTVASVLANRFELTPDSFRLFAKFLPALRNEWRTISFSVGPGFVEAARETRRWGADEVTPFERCRVLDPAPDRKAIDRVYAAMRKAMPAFRDVPVAQYWAGMIDVTPDAVSVISKVEKMPGLVIATGFSGHGFGLGPGAGKLAADLASDGRPFTDPGNFRLTRFTDGTPIRPISGVARR
ncbi:FAD-binding oxidoreductase [Poseidonocella sp. HB161398]|uniref:NAD(P)/FAD-dependent oxidoreductase n=1 Tax=Poseidonocella sp. HB161398 TaxID=2320855 RepID=UPI0011084E82|nr:FAD-binding oxidoreductase [Poseidonocella sp. HB161398]